MPSESKDNDYNGCAPLRMFFPRPSYETPSGKARGRCQIFRQGRRAVVARRRGICQRQGGGFAIHVYGTNRGIDEVDGNCAEKRGRTGAVESNRDWRDCDFRGSRDGRDCGEGRYKGRHRQHFKQDGVQAVCRRLREVSGREDEHVWTDPHG